MSASVRSSSPLSEPDSDQLAHLETFLGLEASGNVPKAPNVASLTKDGLPTAEIDSQPTASKKNEASITMDTINEISSNDATAPAGSKDYSTAQINGSLIKDTISTSSATGATIDSGVLARMARNKRKQLDFDESTQSTKSARNDDYASDASLPLFTDGAGDKRGKGGSKKKAPLPKKAPAPPKPKAPPMTSSQRRIKRIWHTSKITVHNYWDSPLKNEKRFPVRDILLHPTAWTCLTAAQQSHLISLFPNAATLAGGQPVADIASLLNLKSRDNFRADCQKWQEDLKAGRLDPDWLEDAQMASDRRANGDFDEFERQEQEKVWGESSSSTTTPKGAPTPNEDEGEIEDEDNEE
jgi:Asx homology domain